MEASVNVFSDLFDRIRAWIPHRPDTTSRDFWMPDRICRKCYDCDSQFTIFNRRHHCRICGKVFCGLCSVNTIHVSVERLNGAYEEGDRVRVCNYCYKVSRQGFTDDTSQLEQEYDIETPSMTPSDNLTSTDLNGSATAPLPMSQRTHSFLGDASPMEDKVGKLRMLNGPLSAYDSVSSLPGDDQPPSPPTTYGNRLVPVFSSLKCVHFDIVNIGSRHQSWIPIPIFRRRRVILAFHGCVNLNLVFDCSFE